MNTLQARIILIFVLALGLGTCLSKAPASSLSTSSARPAQDWALQVVPASRALDPGGVATYTVSVQAGSSSSITVDLVVASPSPYLTLHLNPTQIIVPGHATLTVTDTHSGTGLLPGVWYDVSITGTNDLTQTVYARLLVGGARIALPLVLRTWSPLTQSPRVVGCEVFPADNIWNTPVDTLPVDANSAAYITTIGSDAHVHADFGSGTWEGGPIGIPYVDVPGTQPRVSVTFDYDDESDPGPYPIPPDAPIEGGPDSDGDRHILVVDRDNCVLYELFYARPQPDGSWQVGSGAIFDLSSHALRPDGWTSADAAGLPILPGLVRYDEVAAGEIRHALRFTAPQTRKAYVWPARHYASSHTVPQYPPMGQRFRLRAEYDISGFSPDTQVILRALKRWGMMLADNGSAWYISGAPDDRWDNDVLHELHQVHGSDFEAVDVSSLMVDPDSGQVTGNK